MYSEDPLYIYGGFMVKELKPKSTMSNRKPKTTILTVDFQKKELVSVDEVNNIKLLLLELKAQEQGMSETEEVLFLSGSLKNIITKIK